MPVITFFCKTKWDRGVLLLLDDAYVAYDAINASNVNGITITLKRIVGSLQDCYFIILKKIKIFIIYCKYLEGNGT